MKAYRILSLALILSFMFVGTAMAGVPILIGDYVWFDENGNGLQDDGADNGINDVRVLFFRDYDCNGVIDGNDEIYDYDYTANDEYGNPGYYYIPAISSFCFIAFLDFDYVPVGLELSTPAELAVDPPDEDYFEVDFGLYDPTLVPEPEFACPKTIGFWKQQFKQKRSAKYTQAELNLIVDVALSFSAIFTSYDEIKDALDIRGNNGHKGKGKCHRRRGNDMLNKAKKQYAAFLLNLAAFDVIDQVGFPAGLSENTALDLYLTDAETVGEAFAEVEYAILNGVELEWAKDIADSINNGLGIDVDCEL